MKKRVGCLLLLYLVVVTLLPFTTVVKADPDPDAIAYVVSYEDDALTTFNVTDPSTPVHLGHIQGNISGVWFGYIATQGDTSSLQLVINADGKYPCPFNGSITKFKTNWGLSGAVGDDFRFNVWELVSGTTYHCVGQSPPETIATGVQEYILDPPINVTAGMVIGYEDESSATSLYGMDWIGGSGNYHSEAWNPVVCNNRDMDAPFDNYVPCIQAYVEPNNPPLDRPFGVVVEGGYAYTTSQGDDTLGIFNVSDPSNPSLLGKLTGAGSPNYLDSPMGLAIRGNWAYVTSRNDNSLTIINITDRTDPTYTGHTSGMLGAIGVALGSGDLYDVAFVCTADQARIYSVDITDPSTPTKLDNTTTGNTNWDIVVSGNYSYVSSDAGDHVRIYDVSDPETLTQVGSISGAGSPNYLNGASGLSLDGNFLYVACFYENSLTVIDVSDPNDPQYEGHISGAGFPNYLNWAIDVWVQEDYAFVVAEGDDALTIFDVSTPSSPSHVGEIYGEGSPNYLDQAYGIFITGYVAPPEYEVLVTSDPELNAGFNLNATPHTTPYSENLTEGNYSFVCTDFEIQVNASYKYTFDHWEINGSGYYGSLEIIVYISAATNLTIVYLGSSIETPFIPTFAADAVNATWYFRSDTHTIHEQLSYKLNPVNTQTSTYDSRVDAGNVSVTYGVRVWIIDIFGNLYEMSGGTPEATVTRSTDGAGILTEYFDCPAYGTLIDAIQVNVYQRFGTGSWSLRRYFRTSTSLYIKLPASSWTIYYYVNRTSASTTAYFFHGSPTYQSKLDLQYFKANPWEIAMSRLQATDFLGFIFTPWTYWLGDIFWSILLLFAVVTMYNRFGSLKPILAMLWLFGGVGSLLSALVPALALHVAWLMLALAMAFTLFKLIYR